MDQLHAEVLGFEARIRPSQAEAQAHSATFR
jgi:hypothetical protein